MAFKLTKKQRDAWAAHRKAVEDLRVEIGELHTKLEEELADKANEINDAIRRYNAAATEAQAFVTEIAEEHRGTYDDRSDTWKEGDAGNSADEFISAWEGLDLSTEVDEVEILVPDAPEIDEIDELPEEADA